MVFIIVEDRIDPDYGLELCMISGGKVYGTKRYCGPDLELAWQIAMRKNYGLGLSDDDVRQALSDLMGETINTVPI